MLTATGPGDAGEAAAGVPAWMAVLEGTPCPGPGCDHTVTVALYLGWGRGGVAPIWHSIPVLSGGVYTVDLIFCSSRGRGPGGRVPGQFDPGGRAMGELWGLLPGQ